jgi:endonuclease YncB( thermonuclease family)
MQNLPRPMPLRPLRPVRVLLVLAVLTAAGAAVADRRHRAPAAEHKPSVPPAAGLVLGEYPLGRIVDGDTLVVDGLDASLRLLGMDTEETFKTRADRKLFGAGWPAYLKAKRGDAPHPVKMATPLGEDAKAFAKRFFDGVTTVRLERDEPREIRDRYDRYLAYVLVKTAQGWRNYNVEGVRAGMSPYFTKYGYSRRYHQDFLAAEAEARAAHRGIWAPGAQAYPDYPERAAWWRARAEFIDAFRKASASDPSLIDLTHEDAPATLEAQLGKPVTVLATVGEVRPGHPARVLLSRRRGADLPLIVFSPEVLAASHLADARGEFITVRGAPSIYEHPQTHHKELQIVVDRADQITLAPRPSNAPTDAIGP